MLVVLVQRFVDRTNVESAECWQSAIPKMSSTSASVHKTFVLKDKSLVGWATLQVASHTWPLLVVLMSTVLIFAKFQRR